MKTEVAPQPICLIEEALFAATDIIHVDGRVSWFPETARGYAPINVYALRDGTRSLIIDTGIPLHEQSILHQLGTLITPDQDVSLLLTRTVEFDSVSNATAIIERFDVTNVYSHFVPQEWLHFQPMRDPSNSSPVATWKHPISGDQVETPFARVATIRGVRI
jgi:hypothetical protein